MIYASKLKIKKSSAVYYLIGFVILFDILYKTSQIYYIPFGISLFIVFLVLAKEKMLIYPKTAEGKLFLIFVIYSLMTCFCSDGMEIEVVKNLIVFILFFLSVIMIARYTNTYARQHKLFKIILIVYGSIFVVMFILNYQSINLFVQIRGFLSVSTRYQYAYGFGHQNDAGLNSLTLLIISFIYVAEYKKLIKVPEKIILLIISVIAVIVLLSSSCRNAILSLVVFSAITILLNRFRRTRGGTYCVL